MLNQEIAKVEFLNRFDKIVEQYPENMAISYSGNPYYTYKQLQEEALAIADMLTKSGAAPEKTIALEIEKSPEYVAALLGTWYSGAAFIPVDPSLPEARKEYILSQSKAELICTLDKSIKHKKQIAVERLRNEDILKTVEEKDINNRLAYVIFTSGSSGAPKGVLVTHSGIVNFLDAQIEAFKLDSNSRALFYLSTSFDASISDIGTALLSGATLCLEPLSALEIGPSFSTLIEARNISHMDIPPALLPILDRDTMPDCLKTIIIGGEPCSPAVIRHWAEKYNIVNVYGPTEATVCTSLCQCNSRTWQETLIGQPINNINYFILDQDQKEVDAGQPGELYIGGISLARGYLNQDELTKKKFVHINNQRLYRTNDRVIKNTHGQYVFLGRSDRQFKLRGMLIEPGEIEARLLEHPNIKAAAVVKRKISTENHREILAAFIVTDNFQKASNNPEDSALVWRKHLEKSLPKWMIPNKFMLLDKLPDTTIGKTDYQYLSRMPLSTSNTNIALNEITAKLDQKANILLEVFKDVLAIDHIGLNDNFFELGGDSFAVIEVVASAESRGLTINPQTIMQGKSINAITALLNSADTDNLDGSMTTSKLRESMKLTSQWQSMLDAASKRKDKFLQKAKQIFLTGSTGFLGGRLLCELLERSDADIYCLVRADNAIQGKRRIEKSLAGQGLSLPDVSKKRLHIILGDISKEQFGLNDDDWQKLCHNVDTIYHCAAHVNMILPYEELYPANVLGTFEIIRLMAQGKIKCLHYASTLSVFVATDCNTGLAMENDCLENTKLVYGGYAQSKWSSEVLLRSTNEMSGPISYYRLGLITGDSKTGLSSPTDFLNMFIQGIITLGAVPQCPDNIAVDVTPIDFAANAMTEIAINSQEKGEFSTYHLANKNGLRLTELIDQLRLNGHKIKTVEAEKFLQRIKTTLKDPAQAAACLALCRLLPQNNSFSKLRSMDLFQATDISFDMTNTEKMLGKEKELCLCSGKELLTVYLKNLAKDIPNASLVV